MGSLKAAEHRLQWSVDRAINAGLRAELCARAGPRPRHSSGATRWPAVSAFADIVTAGLRVA